MNPLVELLWSAQEILENLDQESHALWTKLEARLETFRQAQALELLSLSLAILAHALDILAHALDILAHALEFLCKCSSYSRIFYSVFCNFMFKATQLLIKIHRCIFMQHSSACLEQESHALWTKLEVRACPAQKKKLRLGSDFFFS